MEIRIKKGGTLQTIETDDYTAEELSQIDDRLQVAIDQMVADINAAKTKAYLEGVYADPEWFNSVNSALRASRRTRQSLVQEISRRRKAQKGQSFAHRFVDAAKSLLADETYEMLAEAARETEAA